MRLTEIPLLLSAIAFLLAYARAVLGQLQGGWSTLAAAVMTLSWAIFAVDYFVRLHLAEDKRTWFVRNLLDLAIVLLPMLRPLRLLRLVSVLAVFQRIGGTRLVGRVALYVSVSTVMLILVGSPAMLSVERHQPGATITSYGDALWRGLTSVIPAGPTGAA